MNVRLKENEKANPEISHNDLSITYMDINDFDDSLFINNLYDILNMKLFIVYDVFSYSHKMENILNLNGIVVDDTYYENTPLEIVNYLNYVYHSDLWNN